MWWRLARRLRWAPSGSFARATLEVLAILVSLAWLGVLAAEPVQIPVTELSRKIEPLRTQALSGAKGQTFVVPSEGLTRVDVWLDTQVDPGEWVRVKFELARGVDPRVSLASGVFVFERSGRLWQPQLRFDPALVAEGDRLYLRLESILSAPTSNLFFRYSRRDVYPEGELLDLDRVEVADQDLIFKLYRAPTVPKPFAWADALIGRATAAAAAASGPPGWVIVAVTVLGGLTALGILVASTGIMTRLLPWPTSRLTRPAVFLALLALASLVVAGTEAPFGKLVVNLV